MDEEKKNPFMQENVKQGETIEPLGNGIQVIVSKNHRFYTDSILLASFSEPRRKDRAVDLGSGCGVIPLLWNRDAVPSYTAAVELQNDACDMLSRSIKLCQLEKKIDVIEHDLKDLKGILPAAKFDLVVCNPPYRPVGAGILSKGESAKIIRHETECTLEDIVQSAARLLQFSGRFCLCQRPQRLADVISAMRHADLEPKRLRFVEQRSGKEPKLFLIEGKKGAKPELRVMPTLLIEGEDGDYSDEMKQIYGAYIEGKK